MRIRGVVSVAPITNATGSFRGAVAVKVDDVAELGLASPALGPSSTDRYGEWFGFTPIAFTGSVVAAVGSLPFQIDIDYRAKRKIDELNQSLILAADNAAGSAQSYGFTYNLSVLIALP